MRNKLGVNEDLLEEIEKKIIKIKLDLIDETFTFNSEKLNFEYLKRLNKFLFSDIYYECDLGIRENMNLDEQLINDYLEEIIYISIYYKENIEQILKLITNIWSVQPFKIGNTRTLIGYLKVLNSAFELNLNIDISQEIVSKTSFFELNNLVNQNRLTKIK